MSNQFGISIYGNRCIVGNNGGGLPDPNAGRGFRSSYILDTKPIFLWLYYLQQLQETKWLRKIMCSTQVYI